MSPAMPSPAIPYSASQQDLFYPAKDLSSFPTGRRKSDAELCGWMCLLAYLQNVNCKLRVTGRSGGAAMATLLASLKPPAAFYTIGSPRVGDANFVRSLGINAPSDDAVAADRLIASAEHLIKCAWKSGNVGVRDLADHAPINYVAAQT